MIEHLYHLVNNKDQMSTKNIPVNERLIFALDVPSIEDAKNLVRKFDDAIHFYKLGLEIFMAGGYYDLINWLVDHNKQVFVDLKFFDVSETVRSAVRQLRGRGATFASVMSGNDDMLKAAVEEKITPI